MFKAQKDLQGYRIQPLHFAVQDSYKYVNQNLTTNLNQKS